MGRKKRWGSQSERQAAYRKRRMGSESDLAITQPATAQRELEEVQLKPAAVPVKVQVKGVPLARAVQRRDNGHHGFRCSEHPYAVPIPQGKGMLACGLQKLGCKTTWKVS